MSSTAEVIQAESKKNTVLEDIASTTAAGAAAGAVGGVIGGALFMGGVSGAIHGIGMFGTFGAAYGAVVSTGAKIGGAVGDAVGGSLGREIGSNVVGGALTLLPFVLELSKAHFSGELLGASEEASRSGVICYGLPEAHEGEVAIISGDYFSNRGVSYNFSEAREGEAAIILGDSLPSGCFRLNANSDINFPLPGTEDKDVGVGLSPTLILAFGAAAITSVTVAYTCGSRFFSQKAQPEGTKENTLTNTTARSVFSA